MTDKKKVLIIDDDPAICESVQAILQGSGFDASYALSGKDGLEAFRKNKPDIVLCDMMMEDIDAGGQVTKIMRRERPETPVFLLSTIGDATATTVGLAEYGFSGVFQKPVNFDLLLTVLGRYARSN
ncbi:MAG TPA: response regulator [Candidatus Aminicenantes bacterium]|nr:response regulator [Candidatus Aminicenantes bacterium]HRY63892.1 response regulator [Candidatus Aminicenantes bacterium]HRZ70805.1 response regulator [Candidatus Aminicenantes bacterium]